MANTMINATISSASALNPEEHIPTDLINDFAKEDFPALQNRPAKFSIIFGMKPLTAPISREWRYIDAATRDTAYAFLKASANGTNIICT